MLTYEIKKNIIKMKIFTENGKIIVEFENAKIETPKQFDDNGLSDDHCEIFEIRNMVYSIVEKPNNPTPC